MAKVAPVFPRFRDNAPRHYLMPHRLHPGLGLTTETVWRPPIYVYTLFDSRQTPLPFPLDIGGRSNI